MALVLNHQFEFKPSVLLGLKAFLHLVLHLFLLVRFERTYIDCNSQAKKKSLGSSINGANFKQFLRPRYQIFYY